MRHSWHPDSSWLPDVGTDMRRDDKETHGWRWKETDTWQGRVSCHGNIDQKEINMSFSENVASISCLYWEITSYTVYIATSPIQIMFGSNMYDSIFTVFESSQSHIPLWVTTLCGSLILLVCVMCFLQTHFGLMLWLALETTLLKLTVTIAT